ncbi:hypothetical protein [Paenibacillus glycinis]|uniref:DUF5590 domain-containing protein n=1 Tax=Paenibacillus glycinis TaxID=2697035 RepID=A0ABW9XNC6_9BACL|nr:hypothetical protein [Paenibacillus glycinis]NBD24139.1 hypothetical protein [Paenibacillus glycinis]
MRLEGRHLDISKRMGYALIAVSLIAVIAICFLNRTKQLYGNDQESIQKVIHSIKGYEDASVEILDIKDIGDKRIVGFLSNNDPAYIQFSKNQTGNYEWQNIEKHAVQPLTAFLFHNTDVEVPNAKFMIVTNDENKIAKLELEVNKQVLIQTFSLHRKSVTWIDLPSGTRFAFKYKYYDQNDKLLRAD